jgi:hypothetical protein
MVAACKNQDWKEKAANVVVVDFVICFACSSASDCAQRSGMFQGLF